ncbi:MAG: hypothetical protein PVSMB6_08420 [Steroidobacteraceae bacterium]
MRPPEKMRPVIARARRRRDLLPPVSRQPTAYASVLAAVGAAWLSGAAAQAPAVAPVPTPAAVSSIPASAASLPEVTVARDEPKFVAPTRRDRVGRIWAPVMIDGRGPFRLVLDTGASHSALIQHTADALREPPAGEMTLVTGVTGSATVPTVHVGSMEVGELLLGPTFRPVVADVFGGAQGVLGREGLAGMRIFADFRHDRLTITRSRNQHAGYDYTVVPLRVVHDGLLMADVLVGRVRTHAIIDTGAEQTVGNVALRSALLHSAGFGLKHQDIIGVTLDVQSGDNVATPPILLGKMTLAGVRVTFGDMYLFQHWDMTHEPTLLVGMDILGSFEALVIDYRTHQLELRAREVRPDWLNRPVEPGQYKPF